MKDLIYLDVKIGEARCVKDVTCRHFDLDSKNITVSSNDWEYNSTGLPALRKYLEDKHNAKVIITNGANQGLHACLYALKVSGKQNIGIRLPIWNRIPDMAQTAGVQLKPIKNGLFPGSDEKTIIDSALLVAPNNPDGSILPQFALRAGCEFLKSKNIPLIHDAAYYTKTYLPKFYQTESIGDMQIFSISKAYGLSALRLGYIVVHNDSFYQYLHNYVEYSTVGASAFAQHLLLHILKRESSLPFVKEKFEDESREEITKSKNLFKTANPKLVEIPTGYDYNYGMFAWVKPKIKDLFKQLNIGVLDGELFGKAGFVRINLAAGFDITTEIVNRINEYSI